MEMERSEAEVVVEKRHAIMDITTLLDKGIKIPDLQQFMWT
jgi:hypothetical protein